MRTDKICWPSSRGFITSCTTYASKNRQTKIIREQIDNGTIVKRIDQDLNGIIKKIITYITTENKFTKNIDIK